MRGEKHDVFGLNDPRRLTVQKEKNGLLTVSLGKTGDVGKEDSRVLRVLAKKARAVMSFTEVC